MIDGAERETEVEMKTLERKTVCRQSYYEQAGPASGRGLGNDNQKAMGSTS